MNGTATSPLFSVIIPIYNAAAYLSEAVESVRAQTFASWDAWLIDDGSKDDSPLLARQFAVQHPERIHSLEHENHANRGVSATRNLGIARSRGEFVAFLDADDMWEPDKLHRQVEVLDRHPEVGLVYSSGRPINADGSFWSPGAGQNPITRVVFTESNEPRVGFGTPNVPLQHFAELVQRCPLVTSSVMVRRSLLDKVGGFDESMHDAEDWHLYTCIAYHARTFFIDEPLIRYRIHSQNASVFNRGNELDRFRGSATFLRKLEERLGSSDPELQRLLAEARRMVYGRALSRAEEARREGNLADAECLYRFARDTFPSLFWDRRTARYFWNRLFGR